MGKANREELRPPRLSWSLGSKKAQKGRKNSARLMFRKVL
jgi:hypothetical protein